jgi:hypothetical protein
VAYGILVSAIINLFVVMILLNNYFGITFWNVLSQTRAAIIAFSVTFFLIVTMYVYTPIHPLFLLVLLFLVYFMICAFFYRSDIKQLFYKKG